MALGSCLQQFFCAIARSLTSSETVIFAVFHIFHHLAFKTIFTGLFRAECIAAVHLQVRMQITNCKHCAENRGTMPLNTSETNINIFNNAKKLTDARNVYMMHLAHISTPVRTPVAAARSQILNNNLRLIIQ